MKANTFVDLLQHQADRKNQSLAYTFLGKHDHERGHLSFLDLDLIARKKAVYLSQFTHIGDRIILAYPSGLDFVTSFLGCLYAGLVAVPVYLPKSNGEWERFFNIAIDCKAQLVLCKHSLQENIQKEIEKHKILKGFCSCLHVDNLGDNLASLWKRPNIDKDSFAFLQYTSGTTGNPKGVCVSHKNLLHNESLIEKNFQHKQDSIVGGWLPLFHDMGLIGNTLHGLYLGTHTVFMSPLSFIFSPIRWLKMITEFKVTTSGGPNFGYDHCINRIKEEELEAECIDLRSWDIAFNGSEMIRANTLNSFSKRFEPYGFSHNRHFPCYGMAETTLFVTGSTKGHAPDSITLDPILFSQQKISRTDRSDGKTLVSCGHAEGQEVIIVNPKTQVACNNFEIGEVWVKGDSVSSGYWEKPTINQEIFQAYTQASQEGPYLRTGDAGFFDKNGELYITGRLKEMIIIRGRNFFPQDIELIAQSSTPMLRHGYGAAFAVDTGSEEKLVLVNEVRKEKIKEIDPQRIYTDICSKLRDEQSLDLSTLVLIKQGSLPKTTSGKIQRKQCKELFLKEQLLSSSIITH